MKLWIPVLFLFTAFSALSQPANDDCLTAIDLGKAPYCEDTYFSNIGATPSDIGPNNIPPCWDAGTVQRDVWVSFIASDTILDYSISIIGESDGTSNPLTNPQVAVYRGDCAPGSLFFFGCYKANNTGDNILKFSLSGLTPSAVYWLRISDFPEVNTTNAGTFKLCIEKKSPITNIIEGFSKDCDGLVVDSGGEDGNYGSNETYTFTICPEFPSACIDLNFIYYNLDFNQDIITVYDGPDVNSPQVGTIVGGFGSLQDSWGGVCNRFTATSGCITIRFTSNGTEEFEGFLAEWKCSPVPCKTFTQPLVQSSFTENEVLLNLTSTQAIVTFDTLICADGASGLFFNGDQTDLGLNKGIILTTGNALLSLGPNNQTSAGIGNGRPGDSDLDILSTLSGNSSLSFDACILELDVYANTNEISFEYIFGSEEYPEFVGSNFNDIFAFLISGPGITGIPQINNQDNMAILPGGTPVEINSVNYQDNWQYFRNNNSSTSIQYDGLTSDSLGKKKSLTARYDVTPCNTYHLKLAIADRGDSSYDSGVFISEIKGGAPAIGMNFKNGVDYLVEDCTNNPDELVITLNSPLENPISYNVAIGGSATLGVDYALTLPSIITFQPGETTLSFPIIPLSDNVAEGDETITITLSNDFGCGSVIFAVFTIIIRDELKITVNGGQDTTFFCPGTSVALNATGALDFFWEPVSIFNDPTAASTLATPPMSMWIKVTGQLGICTAVDSVYLLEVNPQIEIQNSSPQNICQGDLVTLIANNNLNGQGSITWSPTFGLNPSNKAIVNASPTFSTFYVVTANLTGCEAKDTILFNVDPFNFPLVIPDVTICEGTSIKLANDILFTSTTYTWTPAETLDDSLVSGPIATPSVTTTYKLVATSQSGFCSDSVQTEVTVLPADVSIVQPDTVYLCLGDSIILNANFTPGGILTWLPADSTKLIQSGNAALAYGNTAFWAYSQMSTGPCTVIDSIWVQVDSLPELTITKFVDRPIYCEGEIITFISKSYLNQDYPDIEHLWAPNNSAFLTADSNLNIVLTARESFTYIRQTTNNACVENQEVSIEVIPLGLMLSADVITLCPGETMQVEILNDSIENIMWTPPNGLSCTECPDPIITGSTTTFYQVMGEEKGCNKQGGVAVNVPVPVLNLPQSLVLCQGESGNLNPGAGPTTTYFWTSSDPLFGTSTDPNPTVTPMSNAIYYVTATLDGCERTGEVPVALIVPPTVTIAAPSNAICFGESVLLTATGLPVGGDYLWSPNQETSPTITVNPPVTSQYSVIYTTPNDCFADTAIFQVTVDVPLDIELLISPDQDTFVLGTPLTVTANIMPVPPAGSVYVWKINGNVASGTNGNVLETTASGPPFEITVEITTPAGCENIGSEIYTVTIPSYKLANLFTPNNDDTNDYFTILLDPGLTITDFKVFSRWGKMVYDNDNPAEGWDGKFDGQELPSDVYAYLITLRFDDGSLITLRGDVTLVR
jgi:gliding motility-associated-like protein